MIRKAEENDIAEIVQLLKESLGEDLIPKSEKYWRWKHIENPFGISPVLVQVEDGKLVAVRAFMRWKWRVGDQVFSSVRAVDTATSPLHQGKGIFRKLTLALVEQCAQSGDIFVFNTPNRKSMPGYLKMGWRTLGKFPVNIRIVRPFAVAGALIRGRLVADSHVESNVRDYFNDSGFSELVHQSKIRHGGLGTDISVEYFNWRYLSVPVTNYVAVGHKEGSTLAGLAICRLKSTKMGKELRVTDCLTVDDMAAKKLSRLLLDYSMECKADYISWAGSNLPLSSALMKVGPVITVRHLAAANLDFLHTFDNWRATLGDLELF